MGSGPICYFMGEPGSSSQLNGDGESTKGQTSNSQSDLQNTYADNALIASNMNAKPGGKQHMLRDTEWEGTVQKMVTDSGVPKGLIQVLKERGWYRAKMKLEQMRKRDIFPF